MIALLRQVADPGDRRRRALGAACASTASSSEIMTELGCFLQAQRGVGVPVHAARRGAARARASSSTTHGDDLGKRSTVDLDVLLAELLSHGPARHPGRLSRC